MSDSTIQVKVQSKNLPSHVKDSLASARFWYNWIWPVKDQSMKVEFFIEGHEGFVTKSTQGGKGGFKILSVESDSLVYQVISDNQQFVESGVIRFHGDSLQTSFEWESQIDFSANILASSMFKPVASDRSLT